MKNQYEEHLAFLNSLPDINHATDEDYLVAFKRLLKILPNNGKLYKYKSGSGSSFNNTYQSLKNNYIWIPNINDFNDKFDCSINYDYEQTKKALLEYLDNNKNIVFRYHLKKEKEHPEIRYVTHYKKENEYLLMSSAFIDSEGRIDRFGLSMKLKECFSVYSEQLLRDIEKLTINAFNFMLKRYDAFKKELMLSLGEINNNRDSIHVFCLCEKYNLNSMWAHYCKNCGLVVEYDFTKLLNQDISFIKHCISLYKVKYCNKPVLDLAYLFKTLYDEKQNVASENMSILEQLISKDKSWGFEKEWRLILLDIDNEMPLDIVSAIYIDYDLFVKKKCIKLLSLANKRKWKVFVRKQNELKTKYLYIRYKTGQTKL